MQLTGSSLNSNQIGEAGGQQLLDAMKINCTINYIQ